jgi:hypothetical protein
VPNDFYATPGWCTRALIPHRPRPPKLIWEPAAGNGAIVGALESAGHQVIGTDITTGDDFLLRTTAPPGVDALISNPPFRLGAEFIRHALKLMESPRGTVAMLLRIDHDSAKTRGDIYDHRTFCKKVVLLDRIRWFEGSTGAPSFNHCWMVFDWQHEGPPSIAYAAAATKAQP